MVAAERLYKKMILPIFDYFDVAWHGCGKVNPDALESLQHRVARLIFRYLRFSALVNRRNSHWFVNKQMPSRFSSTLFE